MDYIISNGKQYIGVDNNSSIIACDKAHCKVFSETKARNTWKALPKSLKNLNFKLVPITDMITEHEVKAERILQKAAVHAEKVGMGPVIKESVKTTERKSITNTRELCSKVEDWIHKVESYKNLSKEARRRRSELIEELSNIDKKKSDIEHEIEFHNKLDACTGYKMCKELQIILQRRRDIKDEIFAVELITDNSLKNADNIIKSLNGLRKRKYEYRIQEEVRNGT